MMNKIFGCFSMVFPSANIFGPGAREVGPADVTPVVGACPEACAARGSIPTLAYELSGGGSTPVTDCSNVRSAFVCHSVRVTVPENYSFHYTGR